jgi:hypothetical protein
MAVTGAVPEAMRGRHSSGDDYLGADRELPDRELPDRGPAREVIAEMARLLRDTRGSMLLGGSVLSAITIGIALEAAFSSSVLRPGVAGLAGRPVLDQLNDQRWRAGAPVDPRVRWLTLPPIADSEDAWNWTRVNLLLGAARIRMERIHLADTWTFITAACFLAWTVTVLLGR